MEFVNSRIPEQAQAAMQAAACIQLAYLPGPDIAFFQWLLLRARAGTRVEMIIGEQDSIRGVELNPQYFQHLEQAGGRIFLLPEQYALSPFILLDQSALMPETNEYRDQNTLPFKLERQTEIVEKLRRRFEQWKENSRMISAEGLSAVFPSKRTIIYPAGSTPAPPPLALQNTPDKSPEIRFHANPRSVEINERFELSWEVEGADQVSIQPLLGTVPGKGHKILSAEKTVEFCLTATRGNQRQSKLVTVAVNPDPKIEYLLTVPGRTETEDFVLSAPPAHPHHYGVAKGHALRLYWHSYNAQACTLNGEPVPVNGNMLLTPAQLSAYTLSASGNGRTDQKTIVIDVFQPPVIEQMTLDPVLPLPATDIPYPPRTRREAPGAPATYAQTIPPAPPGKTLRDFFWFCSGASRDILLRCPSAEGNKYAGIGATVFFTGLLAALSGGYALYVAFKNLPGAVLFGLLWGAAIFNLDRLIVSTIKKEATPARQWRQALPRLLLALVLSVVIAKPLELRVFKPEIDEILAGKQAEKLLRTEALFRKKTAEVETRIDRLKAETAAGFRVREALYQEYRCECDGTCGTGRVGRGTECERKEAKYRQADREYQALKAENDRLIASARAEAGALKSQEKTALQEVKSVHADGLVARLSGAAELPFWPGFFIALLILMVEIAPVLSKILAPPGAYDHALRVEETRFTISQDELLQQQQEEMRRDANLRIRLHQAETDQQVEQKREILRLIAGAQVQLAQEQVERWLEKERMKKPDAS